jgi:hypothetical protein
MEPSTPNPVVTTESRKDVQTISRLLLELVAGKTGFPIDSLSLPAILILMLEADFSTPTKNVITLIMTE